MKREASSESRCCTSDERPAKVPRRGNSSTNSELSKSIHDHANVQPLSPYSSNRPSTNPDALGHQTVTPTFPAHAPTELTEKIYQWIPAPSEQLDELEVMSQPPSKRSRSRSISTDRGRARSVSSENSESSSARDTRSYAYKAANYATILETKNCFMRQSSAGPMPDDIALCERLLRQPIETPRGTMFDDKHILDFRNALQDRSEARLLVDLHPLIMPSAENQYIQGKEHLKNVIDGYNDPWLKTEPIYGPKPQPDHARGLKWSSFSESQRRKLGVQADEKSPYTPREEMYFPYLTAEIKCGNQALKFADRQNMHSMCVALRAVVSLFEAAGRTAEVHRRILGFSISHELEGFRIYGYYPEVDDGKVSYYRWPIAQPNVWTPEDRWTCYGFVENVDREFLPLHTKRLMSILEKIPDPDDEQSVVDADEPESQLSIVGSLERPGYRRAASSQNRGLQPELRIMVQALQQQLAEQKEREEKRDAEQRAREEKLLAQLEEQKLREERREAEQKAREEKLLTQLEQQRKANTDLQAKLIAFLERAEKSV
ncbi:hypothetical protein N7468_009902 [Penicillium chermesinum]|uniref:DUF7924 domain-containing protein n=1 Tax=Penicillium chermesinum TaxID=63820 RepID=A0A9W9NDE5_9EURO|nr:uncharacterized protein N7468_009902 [Penicillium chermesinum]KAJ5216894.1 hypothetical protein N7468_009902 [Penicillium chermesinum]KAJ6171493.1 hypothetical protein N7470_000560 [Penicillium chermesinum]